MSVWYVIPSKRPEAEALPVIRKWMDTGFKVMVLRDEDDPLLVHPGVWNVIQTKPYPGYGAAVNRLAKLALQADPDCDWVVTGGDDYEPDTTINPDQVARECTQYFTVCSIEGTTDTLPAYVNSSLHLKSTFGVMQPTGDRWMLDEQGTCASERVCDAPWLGRDFVTRMYGGSGAYYPYHHFFVDEELHEVATKLGVLWHRPDIKQIHQHWMRNGRQQPMFLQNNNWEDARLLFQSRKARGFPGHEPV